MRLRLSFCKERFKLYPVTVVIVDMRFFFFFFLTLLCYLLSINKDTITNENQQSLSFSVFNNKNSSKHIERKKGIDLWKQN